MIEPSPVYPCRRVRPIPWRDHRRHQVRVRQLLNGKLILIDEVLTPDSSRFWPADHYEPGRDQESFDKQFVRNWLERQPWDKTPPAPMLPLDVVEGTRRRYLEAYERLAGKIS